MSCAEHFNSGIKILALYQGAAVSASDISSSMANEGQRRYEEAIQRGSNPAKTPPTFSTSDLGSLSGSYDVVTCLDVMIHYPQVCMACLVAWQYFLAACKCYP